MVTFRKFFFLLAGAILLTATCGREKERVRIGVSLLNRQHDFYKELEQGLLETAKAEGVELLIRDADFKLSKQMADIEDLIVQRVNALIICPVDTDGVVQAVKMANEKKIPVFTADISASGGEIISHVASDNVEGGRRAARYLAHVLKGKGKIIIIDWPYVTSVLDRVKGFEEVIAEYPDLEIIVKPDGGAQRDPAMRVTENMLQAHRDVDAIFGINDDSALGALSAVEASGREDIIIVGYDAVPDARAAILRGSALKADVIQYPRRIGATVLKTAIKFLNGEKVEKLIPIEIGIVDKAALEKEQ